MGRDGLSSVEHYVIPRIPVSQYSSPVAVKRYRITPSWSYSLFQPISILTNTTTISPEKLASSVSQFKLHSKLNSTIDNNSKFEIRKTIIRQENMNPHSREFNFHQTKDRSQPAGKSAEVVNESRYKNNLRQTNLNRNVYASRGKSGEIYRRYGTSSVKSGKKFIASTPVHR